MPADQGGRAAQRDQPEPGADEWDRRVAAVLRYLEDGDPRP
ncbi:hypothetical protein ACFOY2_23510 [Nonomuraea purpurea]|uniref:Uncharacterized protein n=1 Tax=Nonomuraea purpurea TaxID=1849276 RepID=A0ABV8GDJ1_9ACTN